jgi:hypothetical protein
MTADMQFPIQDYPPRVQDDMRKCAKLWKCDLTDLCVCYLAAFYTVSLELRVRSLDDMTDKAIRNYKLMLAYVMKFKLQKYVDLCVEHHLGPDTVLFNFPKLHKLLQAEGLIFGTNKFGLPIVCTVPQMEL